MARLCLAHELCLTGAGNCGVRLPVVTSYVEGKATKKFKMECADHAGLSQHPAAAGRVTPSSKHEQEWGDSSVTALGCPFPAGVAAVIPKGSALLRCGRSPASTPAGLGIPALARLRGDPAFAGARLQGQQQ